MMRNLQLRVKPVEVAKVSGEPNYHMRVAQVRTRLESTAERFDRRKRKLSDVISVPADHNLPPSKKIKLDYSVTKPGEYSDRHMPTNGLTDLTCEIHPERITLRERVEKDKKPKTENVQFSRTWDRHMKCLICPDRHNMLRSGKELLVVLADQHVPSGLW